MNILILDDYPDNLVLLRGMLESRGFNVMQANNGLEGLSLVQLKTPDLIISDVLMPQMDGFTFCRVVKGMYELKHIPFVFYTATYLDKEDEKLGLALGAARYIHKPTEPLDFLQQIDEVISEYQTDDLNGKKVYQESDIKLEVLHQERVAQKLDKKLYDVEKMRNKEALILETLLEGVIELDLEGIQTFVNKSAAKMFGYSVNEMIGKDGHTLWHHTKLDSTSYDKKDCPIYKSIQEKSVRINIEELFWNKQGESFYVEYSSAPIIEQNEPKGLVIIFRDITQKKKMQKDILSLQAQFDLFMKNLPYVAVIKDETEKIIYANPSAYKYLKEPIGSDAVKNFGEKIGNEIFLLSKEARDKGQSIGVISAELNNKKLTAQILSFAIPQNNGKTYIGTIYIDITKQKEIEQELADKEEMLIAQSRQAAMGEMIAMIAHQWRQPLSIISMNANNLLADLELGTFEESSVKSSNDSILEQVTHLSKTIDDFRSFFRPNTEKELTSIADAIEDVNKIIGLSLLHSNIALNIDKKANINILVHKRELIQVFINILNNAKEALIEKNTDDKEIKITIDENEAKVITTICDNGGGIDNSIINKIFDPYFSTKSNMNGTGLGLYMSKIIVEKHFQGSITAKNKNKGTCLTIELPK